VRVQIASENHPHYEEYGVIPEPFQDVEVLIGGERMIKVELENCPHGVDVCYIFKGQIREIRETDES